MLEKYEKNFDAKEFIRSYAEKKNLKYAQAVAELRKKIPKEAYFQDKIKRELTRRYPDALVMKISQGNYSQAGFPDILMIWEGHYFGFEVKRPAVGEPSKLQLKTIEKIRTAGGTALIVRWPEEATAAVESYLQTLT